MGATDQGPPDTWTEYPAIVQADSLDHPVVGVDWSTASEYCKWAGLQLPSNTEWEIAARGTEQRTYPWGEAVDPSRANLGASDVDVCCVPDSADGYLYAAPVGSFPSGASPFGACDMAGNVWEWTADPWMSGRSIRGGGWESGLVPTYYVMDMPAELGAGTPQFSLLVGFRCARSCAPDQSHVCPTTWGDIKQDRD